MMEAVTNKTLEKLKYDLVREGLVEYDTVEKAQELANAQNYTFLTLILKITLWIKIVCNI